MPLMNPLDVLFRDVRRQLWRETEAKRKAQTQGRVHVPRRQSTYANPQNWRLGKVVRLIHATEGPLGEFQEYFHKTSPTARRLLPAAPGLSVARDEMVFGDWWLHPKFSAPIEPDSEAELRAITQRFNELMDLEGF
jgi:hypothetical protein